MKRLGGGNRLVALLGVGGLIVGAVVVLRPLFMPPPAADPRSNVRQVIPAQFSTPKADVAFRVVPAGADVCRFPGEPGPAAKFSSAPLPKGPDEWGAAESEARLLHKLEPHAGPVCVVFLSLDNRYVFSAASDGVIRVSSAVTGRTLGDVVFPTSDAITALAFSERGGRLAAGFESGKIVVIDLERQQPLFELLGHGGAVRSITFVLDETKLLSGADDGSLGYWSLHEQAARGLRQPGGSPVLLVANDPVPSRNQHRQFVCATDKGLLWGDVPEPILAEVGLSAGVAAETDLHLIALPPRGAPSAGTAAGGRSAGFAANRDGLICGFDSQDRLIKWRTQGNLARLYDLAPIGGDKFFITYGGDKAFEVFSLADRACVARTSGNTQTVTAAQLSRHGPVAVSGYRDGSVLLWGTPNFTIKVRPTGAVANSQVQFNADVRKDIKQRNFAGLDKLAARLRMGPQYTAEGMPKLELFYVLVGSADIETEKQWQEHFEWLQAWGEDQPGSITQQVALADAYIHHAWHARGIGPGGTVTPEGAQSFAERLLKAGRLLVKIDSGDEFDPYVPSLQIIVGKGLGMTKDQVKRMVDKATERDPQFAPTYCNMAEYLLPRWFGDVGDIGKFAAESADKLGGSGGDELYARIACRVFNYEQNGFYESTGCEWPRIKLGGLAYLEHFPEDTSQLFAKMAQLAGDNALAGQLARRGQAIQARRQRTFHFVEPLGLNGLPITSKPKELRRFSLHSDMIEAVFLTGDRRRLVSVGHDGLVLVTDTETGTILAELPKRNARLTALAFDPARDRFAWTSADLPKMLQIWNLEKGSAPLELPLDLAPVALAFDVKGRQLAAASHEGPVAVYDLERPENPRVLPHFAEVRSLTFSADGKFLASGGCEQVVKFWRLDTGKVDRVLPGHDSCLGVIALAPNGKTVAAVSDMGTATLWDFESETAEATFPKQCHRRGLTFDRASRRLLVNDARAVTIINLLTKTPHSLSDGDVLYSAMCLGKGDELYVATTKGQVCVWDIADEAGSPSAPPAD